jgi:hypothetical protein
MVVRGVKSEVTLQDWRFSRAGPQPNPTEPNRSQQEKPTVAVDVNADGAGRLLVGRRVRPPAGVDAEILKVPFGWTDGGLRKRVGLCKWGEGGVVGWDWMEEYNSNNSMTNSHLSILIASSLKSGALDGSSVRCAAYENSWE